MVVKIIQRILRNSMIKLKDLLRESKGPVWIDNKWFPAHTQSTLTNLKYGDKIALYPKLHEKMFGKIPISCLLYTSPSPRDLSTSRMPSSA